MFTVLLLMQPLSGMLSVVMLSGHAGHALDSDPGFAVGHELLLGPCVRVRVAGH